MSKYRSTWHLNEFTLVHTVRYLDPMNGKRFAAPYKTKEKAQAKMDQLKRDDPARRRSFRARHNCDNPGPKTKARYWSCYQWRAGAKVNN